MAKKVLSSKHAEKVLVVKRADIFAGEAWHGLKTDNLSRLLKSISTKYRFLPRSQAEEDARWQQIIPYLIFENSGRIFLMRRTFPMMILNASRPRTRLRSSALPATRHLPLCRSRSGLPTNFQESLRQPDFKERFPTWPLTARPR